MSPLPKKVREMICLRCPLPCESYSRTGETAYSPRKITKAPRVISMPDLLYQSCMHYDPIKHYQKSQGK